MVPAQHGKLALLRHRRWLPKVDLPPAPGSANRVLTYDRAKDEALWEGAVVRRGDPPVHMHFLADASRRAMIELYTNGSAPTDAYRDLHPAQLHVAFSSADPNADADRLVAAGATLIEHLYNPDGSHLTMLRDPWGLAIQLAKRATPMLRPTP